MNAERLLNVADAVIADSKSANLIQLLTNVETSYTLSVQTPSPATAEAFSTAKKALDDAIHGGECLRLSPSRIAILEKIGAADLCGSGLIKKVDSVLSVAVTPAAAVQGFQELRTRAQKFYQTATTLRDSLTALAVEGERPPTTAAEVEVRLPFKLFEGSLGGFAKELKQLDRAISDIVETVTGARPPINIRTLAGGSVELFVIVDPLSGVAILSLVTAVVTLINSVLQTRRTRLELEKDKAPKEVLEPLAKWEQSRVAEELDRLKDELLDQSKADKGRKNELKKALGDSLRYLADRIDRGMDVEVATLLDETASAQSADENAGDSAGAAQKQIAQAMKTRRRLLRSDQPILSLPPILDEGESDKAKEHKAKS